MPESPWTIESLKAHFDVQLAEMDKRIDQRFTDSQTAVKAALDAAKEAVAAALAAQKEAVTKAEIAAEKRFEGVNEFRAQLGDQQRTLMPRAEAEIRYKAMDERIDGLRDNQNRASAQGTGMHQGWLLAIGVVSLIAVILAVLSHFTR